MITRITIIALIAVHAVVASAATRERSKEEYWWLCPVDRSMPVRPEFSSLDTAKGATEVRSDTARVVDNDVTEFFGHAELVKDRAAVRAEEISFDQITEIGRAEGDAYLWQDSFLWRGERALFNLADEQTRLSDGNYWLTDRQGRGQAGLIRNDGLSNITRLKDVDYTTCPRTAETWKFSASKLKLDHDADRGYATHTLIRVKGVPVFYLPYMSFPLSDKRKSGFLAPTAGSSSESGFDFRIPYYLNIAPNQDATITPRVISDRGEMMTGEYRYKGAEFYSEVDFSFLPGDDLENGDDRSSFTLIHQQRYADRRGSIDGLIQNVSDARYLEDFGGSLSMTSLRFLDRRLATTYNGDGWSVFGLLQSYQTVDDSFSAGASGPYKRLPQVIAQTNFMERHLRPHFHALSEVTYFDRENSVTGTRVAVDPTVSLPFIMPWAYVKPSLGLRYTGYMLENAGEYADSENRAVPMFSLDSQLSLERRIDFMGTGLLQTFEPRVYYLLVPKVGQDDTPVFDSGYFDFSFINLFRENRFSGHDRIGDANQLTVAITSRNFSLDSGRELFRTSIGQVYYFRDREITLPPFSPEDLLARGIDDPFLILPGTVVQESGTSEIVGEVITNLTRDLSARVTLQWDPDQSQTNKSAFAMRYASEEGTVVNLGYRQRRALTDVEQTDISFRLPMTESLSLIARWAYSLQTQQALEVVGGIEYESCCWGIRLLSRRYIRNVEGEFDNAIFMQAELKGLAGVGRAASSFLERSIPGYEPFF
ncbi:MAG: hypothetical protein RL434_2836 [Pseudomonadota bacterium]|jgi:LPS-assembly protein